MASGKPDIVLSGKEYFIDLNRISIREWRAMFDDKQDQALEDATLAKVCGLNTDEFLDIGREDWRALVAAIFRKAGQPLANPPSASASTSD